MTINDKCDLKRLISILDNCDFKNDDVYIEFESPTHASVGSFQFRLSGYDTGYVFAYEDKDFLRVNFGEKEIERLDKELADITSEAIMILGIENYEEV